MRRLPICSAVVCLGLVIGACSHGSDGAAFLGVWRGSSQSLTIVGGAPGELRLTVDGCSLVADLDSSDTASIRPGQSCSLDSSAMSEHTVEHGTVAVSGRGLAALLVFRTRRHTDVDSWSFEGTR